MVALRRTRERTGAHVVGERRHRGHRPPRPAPPRSLGTEEIDRALGYLHEPRFVDFSPRTIVAVLLDEGSYVACVRTLYRLLVKDGEAKERRDQLRHERYAVPRLHASAPNRGRTGSISGCPGNLLTSADVGCLASCRADCQR